MTIEERLNHVFHRVFDDESIKIHSAMTAADVDGWDSLSHVQLVVAAEKEFGVKFKTVEITALKNVGDFTALIQRKVQGR